MGLFTAEVSKRKRNLGGIRQQKEPEGLARLWNRERGGYMPPGRYENGQLVQISVPGVVNMQETAWDLTGEPKSNYRETFGYEYEDISNPLSDKQKNLSVDIAHHTGLLPRNAQEWTEEGVYSAGAEAFYNYEYQTLQEDRPDLDQPMFWRGAT
jgi:hypothetical protein